MWLTAEPCKGGGDHLKGRESVGRGRGRGESTGLGLGWAWVLVSALPQCGLGQVLPG